MAPLHQPLDRDGYMLRPAIVPAEQVSTLRRQVEALQVDSAGTRDVLSTGWCQQLAGELRRGLVADGLLPPGSVAVQCTLFNKTPDFNWKVALHQDLSIPVAGRADHPELTGWSGKQGQLFVQAPDALLQDMLAVRLHLDDCGADNGPLRVMPGSHLAGRIPSGLVADRAGASECMECPAAMGDALLMRPLLMHASSRSVRADGMRRVLHFLFGPADPGYGLQWGMAV